MSLTKERRFMKPIMYRTPTGWGVAQMERHGRYLTLYRRRYFKIEEDAEKIRAQWERDV